MENTNDTACQEVDDDTVCGKCIFGSYESDGSDESDNEWEYVIYI